MTPLKAIKAFCIECMGHQAHMVKDCTAPKCPLYEYRMGKSPARQGLERTPAQIAADKERSRGLRLAAQNRRSTPGVGPNPPRGRSGREL